MSEQSKMVYPQLRPRRATTRLCAAFFLACFLLVNYFIYHSSRVWSDPYGDPHGTLNFGSKQHVIKRLMMEARERHSALLGKRSQDVFDAAARYRARRGRHPPPGFDEWMKAAVKSDAVVVEEYFDRIYKDLAPFWALNPLTLSTRASSWYQVVKVRNGEAQASGDIEGKEDLLQVWTDLVQGFAKHLPDVDMPINYMDEPRVLVPFENITALLLEEQNRRRLTPIKQVNTTYMGRKDIDAQYLKPYDPDWITGSNIDYWKLYREGCAPDAPSKSINQITEWRDSLRFPAFMYPEHTTEGYVSNWTAATDACLQPHLRYLHGAFVGPMTVSTSKELIPLFGGSKLQVTNDILIPRAEYLDEAREDTGARWSFKKNGIAWRGEASGGKIQPDTWNHFQRHRLVQMLNGTTVWDAEHNDTEAPTFKLPPAHIYKGERRTFRRLGDWLSSFSNVGFSDLLCKDQCSHLEPYYKPLDALSPKELYKHKFVPSVDGNGPDTKFLSILRSSSVPLKATVYAEWHDDRLSPWLHFVPLDNTFQDIYSVLEYLGDGNSEGDTASEYIGRMGREWADRVLRKEDMALYVWRLLLEWARVCDEKRDTLGFVKDLVDL